MAEIDLKPAVFRINGEGTNEVLENVGTVKLTQVKRIDLATFLHGINTGMLKMVDKDGAFSCLLSALLWA